VSGDREHTVLTERCDGALRAQVLEVRVRVLVQRLIAEEVDLLEVCRHE
jgi:hypothetical protein